MMFRIGLLVAVSIAAYAIKQLTIRTWRSSNLPINCSENGEDKVKDGLDEEEHKLNSISYGINRVNGGPSDLEGEGILSEPRDLQSRESEHPLLDDNKKEDKVQETQMENNMIELERLLKLVMELEERKVRLEGELLMYRGLKDGKSDIIDLRKQLRIKNEEVDVLNVTISSLQIERKKRQEEIEEGALMKKELEVSGSKIKELQWKLKLDANQTKEHLVLLKQQVSGLQAKEEEAVKKEAEIRKKLKAAKDLEVELGKLKTKNRELQHKKQELSIKLDVMEARIRTLTSMTESEMVTKVKEEAHKLFRVNEDLIKQFGGLQMNRFSEVEELVYLHWVNACLRYELRNNETSTGKLSARDLNKSSSLKSKENGKQLMLEYAGKDSGETDTYLESRFLNPFSLGIEIFDNTSIDTSTSRRSSLIEKTNSNLNLKKLRRIKSGSSAVSSPGVIGSSHRWKDHSEALMPTSAIDTLSFNKRTAFDSDSRHNDNNMITDPPIMSKMRLAQIEKMPNWMPRPRPRSSVGITVSLHSNASDGIAISQQSLNAPLPPPQAGGPPYLHDPPGILTRREEVKADVETQGDFVLSLAMEVRAASFSNMEDLVSFVIWLDEELSFLVDERAVLEHFDWPEGKTDALRGAASEYQDLVQLGEEVASFVDNPKLTCEVALKKMYSLLDKVEQSVYALVRTRDVTISQYKEFGIPVDWLLDSGVVGKIKLSSVQLARKYMKRIVNELDVLIGPEKEPNREFLLLQGVRFAFRVHQFAGGFDAESMKAFEELRSCVHTQISEKQ